MNDDVIDRAREHISKRFENDSSGHDVFHSLRVCDTAETICQKEGGDMFIVKLAALLHDVDDRKLFKTTEQSDARSFLERRYVLPEDINRICEIISEVSFKGTDSVTPHTLEGKIVQDADRLDAIGAIGIARAFAYGGNHNRAIHDPNERPNFDMDSETYFRSKGTSINHFYEKLLKLKDMMNTETAKAMAEERHAFIIEFLNEFYEEWDGKR